MAEASFGVRESLERIFELLGFCGARLADYNTAIIWFYNLLK